MTGIHPARPLIAFLCHMVMLLVAQNASAHPTSGEVHYLGNEGVMIESGDHKILFDPLYFNSFGIYQLVPDEMRSALMEGRPPYDDIDAVFISHMHADHFDPDAIADYLNAHASVRLVAPKQAIDLLEERVEDASFGGRVTPISLERGDAPISVDIDGIRAEIVRIPHAGWPNRAEISNLVSRITLNDGLTVMHLGDADMALDHYTPYSDHWVARKTDTAFPPYWFQIKREGQILLTRYLNTTHAIGVHVPVQLPPALEASGVDFFHTPGESRQIGKTEEEAE